MQALAFWKAVTMDQSSLLDQLLERLEAHGIRFCVLGGQAVNAYVEPLVSLDLDLALATGELERVRGILPPPFLLEQFPHSLNVSMPGSDLRVQFQTDPRYHAFVARATEREVLGQPLPVAKLEDVLQGKVWAASDPKRRASKRLKDLADIARLLEAYPQLRSQVPAEILRQVEN